MPVAAKLLAIDGHASDKLDTLQRLVDIAIRDAQSHDAVS